MKSKYLIIIIFILLVLVFALGFYILQSIVFEKEENLASKTTTEDIDKPLNAYTFNNLKKTTIPASDIRLGNITEETDEYIQRIFYFDVPERPNSKKTLQVSGLMSVPKSKEDLPIIIMNRGFIPDDSYYPGAGTSPSAKQLASNGFLTLAPDFLGFAESDSSSGDSFENRFQTYTTSLSLIESIDNIKTKLDDEYEGTVSADLERVGLWGHSNGGHIALATLALTGREYPTVLWAPVSKSFPYSILYYTDETDDQGLALRAALNEFEDLYKASDFSPERYYRWIKAPIQINQGTNDPEIPYWWSDELVEILEDEDLEIEYLQYPGTNHNMQPSWNEAVSNTIRFFNENLK